MAAEQSFKSHARFDPFFHFVIAPFNMLLVLVAAKAAWTHHDKVHLFYLGVALSLFLVSLKTRLYALKNQDRLIRLEERVRLAALLPSSEHSLIDSLTVPQFVGLRFASDNEVCDLARSAARESLACKQIKERVRNWRPDYERA